MKSFWHLTMQAVVKHAILERSHRKSTRVKQLQNILDTDRDPAYVSGLGHRALATFVLAMQQECCSSHPG